MMMKRKRQFGKGRRGFLLAVAVLTIVAVSSDKASAGTSMVATIERARGKVELRAPGEENFRLANEREPFREGTVFRTGAGSEAILKLSKRNFVRVGPNTLLEIRDFEKKDGGSESAGALFRSKDAMKCELVLQAGSILNLLKGMGKGSDFLVRAPGATARATGTVFGASVSPADKAASAKAEAERKVREAQAALYEAEKALREAKRDETKAFYDKGKDDPDKVDAVRKAELEVARRLQEKDKLLKKYGDAAATAEEAKEKENAEKQKSQAEHPTVLWDPSRDVFKGKEPVVYSKDVRDPKANTYGASQPQVTFSVQDGGIDVTRDNGLASHLVSGQIIQIGPGFAGGGLVSSGQLTIENSNFNLNNVGGGDAYIRFFDVFIDNLGTGTNQNAPGGVADPALCR